MSDRSHRKPPLLRKGGTRAVFGDWVVGSKFGLGERGCRCNRFEARLYRRVNARRRALLCPVLWCTTLVAIARSYNVSHMTIGVLASAVTQLHVPA
jgi:hypothetical protein